jgi:hypothetical protein
MDMAASGRFKYDRFLGGQTRQEEYHLPEDHGKIRSLS